MDNDPLKFRGEFSFHYMEDDNARYPPCYEGIATYIPLMPSIEEIDGVSMIKLSGKQSQFKPKCMNLRVNHHNYGMWFSVNCVHHDERFKDKVLWRRAVDKHFTHALNDGRLKGTSELPENGVLKLHGDAPEVANSNESELTVRLVEQKHRNLHIDSVELLMRFDTYDQFIRRYDKGR